MKNGPPRPSIKLKVGDEYRILTHQEGNVIYRHIPSEPDWWREADEEQRKSVMAYFDSDDIFTMVLEISSFMAVDKPNVEDVAQLARSHWALSWLAEVAALADDPFTQEHVILRHTAHHRLVAVAQEGAYAGYNILNSLPDSLTIQGGNLALVSPYDIVRVEDEK